MNQEVHRFVAGELQPGVSGSGAGLLEGKLRLLKDVKVTLETSLGECEVSLSRLGELKAGEVLTLDRMPGDPVDLRLNGVVVARGRLVVTGDYLGVRIDDVAELTP
ncbi:FliM/FliN family flagellar motor switch protein [Paludibacterium paludis]|uniref:Flagellar motor switch protein FliN-like C-terminal domain-containing protein n=1 Tax=Paludibacterium paludis TaxID=1225769 RepID=A0A918UBV6_9NEIS|nr:FliM/FliN family flagellar motor switch protein [Paludibacterium paludis]GGY28907.1 hypothetical protein GCM10011289_35100 [Paludibacterium paludis]